MNARNADLAADEAADPNRIDDRELPRRFADNWGKFPKSGAAVSPNHPRGTPKARNSAISCIWHASCKERHIGG
jgi:hypothetical protein